jgi:4-hydroxy-3-methylbut-2-enyl diphosphate reductase
MGMCAGVRRAIRIAEEVASPRDTTVIGELVHNKQVTNRLRARGFRFVSKGEGKAPSTRTVLVPAHGISAQEKQHFADTGMEVEDATCPLVQHIHETARVMAEEGRFVIVIGKRDHVEVRGIVGDLKRCAVVAEPLEVTSYTAERIGIVCQSTASTTLAERTVGRIRALNPGKDIRYVPTICRATHERQAAVRRLLGEVDALVVVGGRHSNNTLELVNLARARSVPCFHIQKADDIRPAWFTRMDVVGLTAGASTPDEAITAVYERLRALSAFSERHLSEAGGVMATSHW